MGGEREGEEREMNNSWYQTVVESLCLRIDVVNSERFEFFSAVEIS